MSTDDVTEAHVLAAALQGEPTYWFAIPKSGRPLPESWTSTNCFWMYPVEHDLARFTKVNGFNPTDSVYELDPSGVSKVLPSATLKANIAAKRYQKDGVAYFFIPAEEVDWVDREYKAMLKREAEAHVSPDTKRVHARRNAAFDELADEGTTEEKGSERGPEDPPEEETGSPAVGDAEAADSQQPNLVGDRQPDTVKNDDLEASATDREDNESEGEAQGSQARQQRTRALGSHKRRAPHRGTTIFVAPVHQRASGDHKSNEAFSWPAHFIIHRGSADFVCPAATGNTYGFRLDKVTHNGFPVFLLFGSGVNNADDVDPTAHGVPAMETAVVKGEGGDRGMGNTVMIITRPPSEKHGYRDGAGGSQRGDAGVQRRRRRPIGVASDDEELDGDDLLSSSSEEEVDSGTDDGVDAGRRRERGRKAAATAKSTAARNRKAAKAPRAEPPAVGHRWKKERLPLKATGVNTWTDSDVAPANVEQLARQHPFACDTATPVRTTVFPDGTCVTYSTASAERVLASLEKKQSTKAGPSSTAGTRIGGNTPDDDAIRSLLENVQLAQLQNQSASGAS